MLTIAIPFYNEEKNIPFLIENLKVLEQHDFEIIFLNDGSTDNSEILLKNLLQENSTKYRYKILSHEKKSGIGEVFRTAIKNASELYFCMLASDNEDKVEDIINSLPCIFNYSSIMMYNANSYEKRSFFRRILSILFRTYLNIRFDVKILYFNAFGNIYKLSNLQQITIVSDGFFAMSEIGIKISIMDPSVIHVPRMLQQRTNGSSNSVKFSSLIQLLKDYIKMEYYHEKK